MTISNMISSTLGKAVNIAYDKYICDPDSEHLRFGQWFVNNYIKGQWPDLFYADNHKAFKMINQYLTDLQYFDRLPTKIKREENVQ